MIKIAYPLLEEVITVNKGELISLILESSHSFYKANFELYDEIYNKEPSDFVISLENKTLNINKEVFLINHIPSFDINERKLNTALINRISKNADTVELNEELNTNSLQMYKTLKAITAEYDFDLEFNETPDLKTILKAFDIKIDYERTFKIKDLLNWLEVIYELINPKLVIIVALSTYYNTEEILKFQSELKQKNWRILTLENKPIENRSVKQHIYDKDNCYITGPDV